MRTCGDFGGPGPSRAGRTDVHMQCSPPLTCHLRNISRDDSSSSATWNGSELAAGVCGPAGNPPRSRTNEHHGRIRRAGLASYCAQLLWAPPPLHLVVS